MKRALLAILGFTAACGDDPTQIIVEIYGADEIINDVTGVRIRVEGRDGDAADFDDPPRYVTETAIPASAGDFPLTHVIAPLDGDAGRFYRVTAQGLVSGATGVNVISEARATSGFIRGETRVLRLYLPGGPCRDRTCPVTQTCVQGSCEDIVVIPPELLPRRGDDVDAGGDGGFDAAIDANACEGEGTPCSLESLCAEAFIECSTDGEPICVGTGEARSAGSVCREAAEDCDAEETCDGTSLECPTDAAQPDLTVCGDGLICVGGECGECMANAPCDTGNACERAQLACEDVPSCDVVGPADPGTVCRGAAGLCDVAEVCDGTTTVCPGDELQADGMECRSSEGACDLADVCDGLSPTCTNAFVAAATVCNPSQGGCDPAEICDGVSAACPTDVLELAGTVCRPAIPGECDVDEQCDGTEVACPDDEFVRFGTMCSMGVCDGAGSCGDLGCGGPCNTGNFCEIGVIDCSGAAPVCVRQRFKDSTVECRAAMGPCDVPETCTGSDPSCPANDYAPASQVCRPSAGVCDLPDSCTGSGPSCPNDAKRGAMFECRAAAPGGCDIAETCDGTSNMCPMNVFQPPDHVCRAALMTNLCDVSESCPGNSAMCPADAVRPSGDTCRSAAGMCDVEERCDGVSKVCPNNAFLTGTVCRPVDGGCDVAETCSGSAPNCPTDAFRPRDAECRPSTGVDCDAPELCLGTSAACPGASIAGCADLVISEVLPDNALSLAVQEGFVEIYNTADEPVELRSCELTNNFAIVTPFDGGEGKIIAPYGFFLVAFDPTTPSADVYSSNTHPTNAQGEVLLLCDSVLVDACGWGMGTIADGGPADGGPGDGGGGDAGSGVYSEGPPLMPLLGDRSYERKACMASTDTSMITGADANAGNSEDTNRNVDDFITRPTPQPQSSSVTETPRMCVGGV